MLCLTSLLLSLALVSGFETQDQLLNSAVDYIKYQHQHDKTYLNQLENAHRFHAFVATDRKIKEHNQNTDRTWTQGHNKFSDKFDFEQSHLRGYKVPSTRTTTNNSWTHTYTQEDLANLPLAVDWRANGFVTPIKDQGQCGSCWAFSTVGSMEGAHANATGNLVSLSEEDLVDCVADCYGCGGGWMWEAMDWVVKHGGIDTESSYPYDPNAGGSCAFNKTNVGATFSSYANITQGDCAGLLHAVATVGPISVAVDAEGIMNYQTGIYSDKTCSPQSLDHGVLVVGYGQTVEGQKFWIVKNSWGTDWGQDGYIYWSRDIDDMCGICQAASYPIV